MTLAELRELERRFEIVPLEREDLAALLDVADKAKRLADAIYEDSGATQEQHVAAVDLRDALAKLGSK